MLSATWKKRSTRSKLLKQCKTICYVMLSRMFTSMALYPSVISHYTFIQLHHRKPSYTVRRYGTQLRQRPEAAGQKQSTQSGGGTRHGIVTAGVRLERAHKAEDRRNSSGCIDTVIQRWRLRQRPESRPTAQLAMQLSVAPRYTCANMARVDMAAPTRAKSSRWRFQ